MKILAVDPGFRRTGVATLIEGDLQAWSIKGPKKGTIIERAMAIIDEIEPLCKTPTCSAPYDLVVAERMQAYYGSNNAVDPNDLIALSLLSGAVCGHVKAEKYLSPTPYEWKGSQPKRVHHQRLCSRIPQRLWSCNHDEIDAIGLCLWGLDRAE